MVASAVGTQKANMRQVSRDSSSASRSPSFASKRAKLASFSSRRSARQVASTTLSQFTSSFVTSSPAECTLGAAAESRVEKQVLRGEDHERGRRARAKDLLGVPPP